MTLNLSMSLLMRFSMFAASNILINLQLSVGVPFNVSNSGFGSLERFLQCGCMFLECCVDAGHANARIS